MIKINKEYIDRFGKGSYGYYYKVSYNVYLSFDYDTLEYIGVETYQNPFNIGKCYQEAERKLGELYAKGLVDIYE